MTNVASPGLSSVLPTSELMTRVDTGATESAIRLRGVVKRFGSIAAVDGLDLDVPYGTCVGLLGPNGAGKSTTMKALTAQVIADAGELEVLGYRLPEDSKQARAEMGVVPQLDNLDTALTVEQNLLVFAHLYRVPKGQRRAAIDHALGIANLVQRQTSKVDQLSGGMRRRLLIARALLHRPRLLVLDEPTVGLDINARADILAHVRALVAQEGVCVLWATHLVDEIAETDDLIVLHQGRMLAHGPVAQVLAQTGEPNVRAAFTRLTTDPASDAGAAT
jgi:lipooligosaccharide transport system ATP-binding protein